MIFRCSAIFFYFQVIHKDKRQIQIGTEPCFERATPRYINNIEEEPEIQSAILNTTEQIRELFLAKNYHVCRNCENTVYFKKNYNLIFYCKGVFINKPSICGQAFLWKQLLCFKH